MQNSELLFVYGTLRPPRPDTPAADARFYSQIAHSIVHHTPATLTGAALYDLGPYPALIPGDDVIVGDLLQVDAATLAITDRIEGHPVYYRRTQVTVQTTDGDVTAWVYWAPAGLTTGKPRITNGDWLRRHEAPVLTITHDAPTGIMNPVLRGLIDRLAKEDCCWLSSVRPDGRAHSAPIWHVWHQGRVYVVTRSNAVRTANIAVNPNVVVTLPDPMNPLILEGWATQAETMRAALQPLFQAKYNWNIQTDTAYDVVIEITPTRLIAWGQYGEGKWPGSDLLQVW
jgi:gamma-glutamylcyclotransferase (GGCT)/AIG2-like uncharacterized protein YtfP